MTILVRKTGVAGWPWCVWCSKCDDSAVHYGVNTFVGWRTWDAAMRCALKHFHRYHWATLLRRL